MIAETIPRTHCQCRHGRGEGSNTLLGHFSRTVEENRSNLMGSDLSVLQVLAITRIQPEVTGYSNGKVDVFNHAAKPARKFVSRFGLAVRR